MGDEVLISKSTWDACVKGAWCDAKLGSLRHEQDLLATDADAKRVWEVKYQEAKRIYESQNPG